MLVASLAASLGLLSLTSGCTIEGPWHYHGEQYVLTMDTHGATSGNLTVKAVPGNLGSCSWCTAHGTLDTDGHMEMHYDNGDANMGTVSEDCKSFSWGWQAGTGTDKPIVPKGKCVPGAHHHPSGPPPPANPPNEPNADIKVVHVINSCHLDIGFADSSQGIINRYFDHHFPLAAAEGKIFRSGTLKGPAPKRLGFMFQSWVINMYLDCPVGMGLHCPNATELAMFEEAIKEGDITWHAFPHNAQLEIMDPRLIQAGIQMTHDLDSRFGQAPKHTLSQRDVPGMTRSIIPIIKEYGVDAITVGANDGSTPPNVPDVQGGRDWTNPEPFVWKDPASGEDILAMWNWPGYGSYPHNPPVLVAGLEHALVYNFAGDNGGPQSVEAYQKLWAQLEHQFPNAEVVASTFDNFTDQLQGIRHKLPTLNKEIGDTWVYGVPSDPQKQARNRVINRVFGAAITKLGGAKNLHSDPALQNATRFALKLGEHTDGRDVKSNLVDNYSWKKRDFERAKAPGSKNYSQYAILEESWWEQRNWGVTIAIDTLVNAKHPLADVLRAEVADLQPKVPSRLGFKAAKAGDLFKCGRGQKISIGFDSTGAVAHLVGTDGYAYATPGSTLAQLKYRSYSAADVAEFFGQYCKSNAGWVQHDYGKPGLPSDVLGKIWTTSMVGLWAKQDSASGNCSFIAQTAFEAAASEEYGAAAGWTTVNIGSDGGLAVEVGMFNKSTTRIPEAMFMQFQPTDTNGLWFADKLGEWVASNEIVPGGSQHLQGVMEKGLRWNASDGKHTMTIGSVDAGLGNFGELTAYPSPVNTSADTKTFGSSFVLFDNLWGTNYVEWWPFQVPPPAEYAASSQYFPSSWNNDMVSRYTIELGVSA